jgi:polar amino acid transport system substrate-binding protein
MKAPILLLVIIIGLWPATARAEDAPLPLYFEQRPPYQLRQGDGVEGPTALRAARAFRNAAIPFVWQESTMSRQMHMLRENQVAMCAIGWFKNSERLSYAKFSRPIYRDRSIVALVRPEFAGIAGRSLDEALATPGLRVLVRGKYTYGEAIDKALKRVKPITISSPHPHLLLAEQLTRKRADLIFAAEEEAEAMLAHAAATGGSLQIVRFAEPVPGEQRHIVCTRRVPVETIARLNMAIGAD